MGSEEMNKVIASGKRQGKIFTAICVLCLLVYFSICDEELLIFERKAKTFSASRPKPPSSDQCPDIMKSFDQPKATSWTTKPVWFNMYTDTISDPVHASIINPLTNTPAGAKSYYVSRPGGKLRHCIGNTQTVSCSNIHPAVEFKENQLDAKYSKIFLEKYILMLRNPMTVFPSTVDAKNRKYRNMVGQTPEEGWKKTRDEWFEGMCTGWKAVITSWRSTKYDVGMYLVYEDIFSFNEGPQTLLKLGTFLQEAGFTIPALENTDDKNGIVMDRMHCLWYNLDPESLAQKKEEEYRDMTLFDSFPDYIPTYTQKQKEYLLSEMDTMISEFEDDKALVEILMRYRVDIEENMPLDS